MLIVLCVISKMNDSPVMWKKALPSSCLRVNEINWFTFKSCMIKRGALGIQQAA